MKFKLWLENTSKFRYIGQCDRLRKCGGEDNWQEMMAKKQPVTKEEFESACDVSPLLDEDETLDGWLSGNKDHAFFKSVWERSPAYFIQTHGFEFIFST